MKISTNIALLMFLYFIQGLPYGFQARFLPVFLRSQGFSLTDLGYFKLLLAPWLCKALWAPLVDKYGSKRKWLLWSIFGLILTCAFSCFITTSNIPLLCFVLLSLNLCAATQDIAVDGIAVTLLADDELGQGNTVQVVGYKVGSIFGGGVLVWFIDVIGWIGLFMVLTLLYVESWMFVYVSPKLRQFGSPKIKDEIYDRKGSDEKLKSEATKSTSEGIGDRKTSNHEQNGDEDFKEDGPISDDMKNGKNELYLMMSNIWNTPGTQWLLIFVLVYKLGEQGITGMVPLYLVDKDVSTSDVTFWAGMLGQGLSIAGSVLGGWFISFWGLPVWLVMNQTCLLRVMPMGILLQIVFLWETQLLPGYLLYYGAILGYCAHMVFSGMITTATFTCMMQSSKLAPSQVQATHYTCLATIEVLGKLLFASVTGYMTDMFGYMAVFLFLVVLSVVIIPLFKKFPEELQEEGFEDVSFEDDEKLKTE